MVIRGDHVKDDTGGFSRHDCRQKYWKLLPECQACHGKHKMLFRMLRSRWVMPPDCLSFLIRIRLPRNRRSKHWDNMDGPIDPLERNQNGHPLAALLWERRLEGVSLQEGWKKGPSWDCLHVHRQTPPDSVRRRQKNNGWAKNQLGPHVVETADKDFDLEDPRLSSNKCILNARNVNQ